MRTLQLCYNKKLTMEQISIVENSFQNLIREHCKVLGFEKTEYEVYWLQGHQSTEFKVYDVPPKVADLMIHYMKYLANKF